MLKRLLFLLLLINFISCSPKVTIQSRGDYIPIPYDQEMVVIEINKQRPDKSRVIGIVKIGDKGFTINCGYNEVVYLLKIEARKMGGNAIKIISHTLPSPFGSTCHRIEAQVLLVEGIENLNISKLANTGHLLSGKNKNKIKDIIYRTDGSEVLCNIYNEDDETVYFSIKIDKKTIKTQLNKDQIEKIKYAY